MSSKDPAAGRIFTVSNVRKSCIFNGNGDGNFATHVTVNIFILGDDPPDLSTIIRDAIATARKGRGGNRLVRRMQHTTKRPSSSI